MLIIPESVKSIADGVFYDCSSLNSITIPNRITRIGNGVFYNCSNLNKIIISNSVKSIGDNAFFWCSALKDVYYIGSKEEWKNVIISKGNSWLSESATIHYSSNGVSENKIFKINIIEMTLLF